MDLPASGDLDATGDRLWGADSPLAPSIVGAAVLARDAVGRPRQHPIISAAAMAAPWKNLRRLSAAHLNGPYGYYDAIDYTSREPDAQEHAGVAARTRSAGTPVRTTMAHHQGMMLVSIANTLLGQPMVARFTGIVTTNTVPRG